MRDMLTTISSIIVILFCLSLLIVSGETGEADGREAKQIESRSVSSQSENTPVSKTTLYQKVQSVKFKNGVLIFVTLEQGGLKQHYFQIRDKNVVLCSNTNRDMPINSIKFTDDGSSTLQITIPPAFEVDLLEAMSELN